MTKKIEYTGRTGKCWHCDSSKGREFLLGGKPMVYCDAHEKPFAR